MIDGVGASVEDRPYWWRAAPPETVERDALHPDYDVVIVGAGLTGLRAAIELARSGAKVLVCEREHAGFGACRRNAGYLGRTLKKSFLDLTRARGTEYARRVYQELNAAFETTLAFIEQERIECYANRCGRFIAATSRMHLEQLIANFHALQEALGLPYQALGAEQVAEEMGTALYCGGVVIPDLGSLHPGLYHRGLLRIALAAGAAVATQTDVRLIARNGARFRLETSIGVFNAAHVVIATNGYTPRHLRWYARRVIPFTGYMAATEELPPELLTELIPHRRTIVDSNVNVDFFRPAPDSSCLLLGGSAGMSLGDSRSIAEHMAKLLNRVYPQLKNVRISAAWSGQCAGTFDLMPHVGCNDGIWYGLGYNFSGVPMGTYFGMRIGRAIIGGSSDRSVFSETAFRSMPFYTGSPWFVPLAMRVFDWQDRRLARQSA